MAGAPLFGLFELGLNAADGFDGLVPADAAAGSRAFDMLEKPVGGQRNLDGFGDDSSFLRTLFDSD